MSKTILHISKFYYPTRGGIESISRQVVDSLKDEYDNVVICFSNDRCTYDDIVDGIRVVRVGVQFSLMSQSVSLGYYWKLKKMIRQYHPFAIHIHCPNPLVYPMVMQCAGRDMKIVLHWHSDILHKGLIYRIIQPAETVILKKADLIIATSENYKMHSVPLAKNLEKVKVLPNGINTSNFGLTISGKKSVERIRQKYNGKTIILFTGRHIHYKGLPVLIEAERFIKGECAILIAGAGPMTRQLKEQAKGRSRIEFIGRLSDEYLRYYTWAADIFAFPSNTKAEAFGVALAEAMYCKTVPVVFNIEGSGVNWVTLKDITGKEVPLNDIQAYASAIDELMSNPELREDMAMKAKERIIAHFTEKKISTILRAYYQSLVLK